MNTKIQSFTQLEVWKLAHLLVIEIYKTTELFPVKEKFGLTSQMRRSALSITSNIAEGFGRRSKKEKIQFYYIAKGSVTELQNQMLLSKDLEYLEKSKFEHLAATSVSIIKMLNKIISILS